MPRSQTRNMMVGVVMATFAFAACREAPPASAPAPRPANEAIGRVAGPVGGASALTSAPAAVSSLTIDYPLDGSTFPPEFPPPTWQWRDSTASTSWQVEVALGDGSAGLSVESTGPGLRLGASDPRTIASTNEPPSLTPEQAAAHTWTPDDATWSRIKAHSVEKPARIVITGRRAGDPRVLSRGTLAIHTSKDPVGAPIFYRDV
ncbi:MAG TPA: hypothetical protein VIU64_15730, partial [Polyangia bacterium]